MDGVRYKAVYCNIANDIFAHEKVTDDDDALHMEGFQKELHMEKGNINILLWVELSFLDTVKQEITPFLYCQVCKLMHQLFQGKSMEFLTCLFATIFIAQFTCLSGI